MVLFITSKSAYLEMEDLILSGKYPVWLSEGSLSKSETEELWNQDIEDLSEFSYTVDTSDSGSLNCAVSTIKEHHPGENIWVQINNNC